MLPHGFNFNIEIDFLTIAFNRYNDSLFSNGDFIENRITSAVMGLEALYLKSRHDGSNRYKLSTRVSKIIGLMGQDGIKSKITIEEAYNIRNTFVHGGHYKKK